MFHNFFILFSSVSPSTACCLFSLDTTCPNNHISFIHLMLLFICNAPTLHCKSQDFNTSHVTLYHGASCTNLTDGEVSIHLMLLFIIPGRVEEGKKDMFQYISCYSLSVAAEQSPVLVAAFQYISCYSLSHSSKISTEYIHVSIHLMLLFIETLQEKSRL